MYEFAVIRRNDDPNLDDDDNGIHRGPWSLTECREWIEEGETDGIRNGAFLIVRRLVSQWEVVND